ncbi:hypothetical protein FACS189430_11110 [Bacteroidia bacterium]|nr:hypothetical protein FACS189430_11110 [Bacteroidia bacterium]
MNDRQDAKRKMYQSTLETCLKYEGEWAHIPAFQAAVDELQGALTAIDTEAQQQSGAGSKGATLSKNELATKMVQTAATATGLMSVYAFKTKNNDLLAKTNISKHTLYRLPEPEALAAARVLLAEMTRYADELADYGADEDLRNELEQSIADFQAALVQPRNAIIEKKQYTGNLAKAFAQANSILYDELDKLVVKFKISAPAFYTDYGNARNLIVKSARKREGNNKQ